MYDVNTLFVESWIATVVALPRNDVVLSLVILLVDSKIFLLRSSRGRSVATDVSIFEILRLLRRYTPRNDDTLDS